MSKGEVEKELSDSLGELIAFDSQGRAVWPAEQLRGVLRAELLHDAGVSIEALCEAKNRAKAERVDPESQVPPEVCMVMYYACIAAALVRHNQRISKLGDEDLREGFAWSMRQPWVDGRTRELLGRGMEHLRKGRHWWRKG